MKSPIEKWQEALAKALPSTYCPPTCDGRGTYAEADENGDPTPAQCEWCYKVRLPAQQAIATATAELLLEVVGEDETGSLGYGIPGEKLVLSSHEKERNVFRAELRKAAQELEGKE